MLEYQICSTWFSSLLCSVSIIKTLINFFFIFNAILLKHRHLLTGLRTLKSHHSTNSSTCFTVRVHYKCVCYAGRGELKNAFKYCFFPFFPVGKHLKRRFGTAWIILPSQVCICCTDFCKPCDVLISATWHNKKGVEKRIKCFPCEKANVFGILWIAVKVTISKPTSWEQKQHISFRSVCAIWQGLLGYC